jgi:Holliday junction resolvase-like predicted endonuclease
VSTVRRGNAGELRVQAALESTGHLVAQRRHVGGSGDLLAVHRYFIPLLVEVKTTQGPFDHFGPEDRQAMLEDAKDYWLEPLLAWTPSPSVLAFVPKSDWPRSRPRT